MKKLLFIVFLFPILAKGATEWPILGAEVETNGWVLRLTLSTSPDLGSIAASTNLNFINGHLSNNIPWTGSKLFIDLTSMGYSNNVGIQTPWRLYGNNLLRLPYPKEGTNDIIAQNTTNVVVRLALSDYIYSRDSNILMTTLSGAIINTNGTTTNSVAVNAFTVTNSSVLNYPISVYNWTQVPYYRFGNTLTLRGVGGHNSARNGYPLAGVEFISLDGHSHAVTQVVTEVTIDRAMPDALPIAEHIASLNISSFTVGDLITNHFKAYPLRGDSGSILDTTDGVNGIETPYHHPLICLYDNRPVTYAVVSTTNNSGANGVATTNINFNSPPLAFASISQAARAIADTNNLFFSANVAAGVICIRGGDHSFVGTAASPPTTRPNEWLIITNFPGDGALNCKIANGTGNGDIQDRIALRDVYITSNDAFTFSACSNLWFDRCVFHVTNSSQDLIDGTAFIQATDNNITNFDQGFVQQGSQNQIWSLIRGNQIRGKFPVMHPYTVIGNYLSVTSVLASLMSSSFSGLPKPTQNTIIFNNMFMALNYSGASLASFWGGALGLTNGAYIVQNIFENIRSNSPGTLVFIAADSTTGHVTNVNFSYNIDLGERTSHGYDAINTVPHYRLLWSYKNNYSMDDNIKNDTFSGDTDGAQGARIGAHSCLYGVNYSGNFSNEQTNSEAGGSFINIFYGLGSYRPSRSAGLADPPNSSQNLASFPQFIDPQYHTNKVMAYIANGNGNYRFKSASPVFTTKTDQTLKYDIIGHTRSAVDPPGAFMDGNLRHVPIGF